MIYIYSINCYNENRLLVQLIPSNIFAKQRTSKNVQVYNYTLDDGVYTVELDNDSDLLTVKRDNIVVEKQKLSEYKKEIQNMTQQTTKRTNKQTQVKTTLKSIAIPRSQYVISPSHDTGDYVFFNGDLDTCYYMVFGDGSVQIQVVEWGYESNYGIARKYANYVGDNVKLIETYKAALNSWNSSRKSLINAGYATLAIAAISMYSAPLSASFAKFLAVFGIGSSSTSLINSARNMAVQAYTLRTTYQSISGYGEFRDMYLDY